MKDFMTITINPNGVRQTVKIQEAIDYLGEIQELKNKPGRVLYQDELHVQARERDIIE